jgi:hypothetical protein
MRTVLEHFRKLYKVHDLSTHPDLVVRSSELPDELRIAAFYRYLDLTSYFLCERGQPCSHGKSSG